jgi:transposase-like protein
MANTEAPASTKDQVREMLDADKSVEEIAEALGKTKATIYVHIRNIKAERGEKPRGRGRPPKAAPAEGNGDSAKSRPAPPKAGAGASTKAAPAAKSEAPAKANGAVSFAERFPLVKASIEQELAEKRKEVAILERMLETAQK